MRQVGVSAGSAQSGGTKNTLTQHNALPGVEIGACGVKVQLRIFLAFTTFASDWEAKARFDTYVLRRWRQLLHPL